MNVPFNPYFAFDSLLSRDPLRITRNRLLSRITAPSTEPVTLAEAKLYLRVDNTNEDTLITDLITAARMVAENWLKRSLITQSWKLAFDNAVASSVYLPMGPVNSVISVIIVNQDGSTTTVDPSQYWLNAAQNALVLNSTLTGFRIEMSYNAGYGVAEAVPKPIKQGILGHIAAMYDSRGNDGDSRIPEQVAALYAPYREVVL